MASLAQQESQSMSQNIRIGLQYRFQQGKVQVNHSKFLGYTKDDDGLTRRFIERITVRDSGFTVMLRSGIEVEIDN